MKIPQPLRVAKRRTVKAVTTAVHRGVVRGVLQNVFSYPTQNGASPPRALPHVLIARYNYYAHDAAMGPSIEEFLLDNTLAAANAGTADTFFWETDSGRFPRGDWALLERCRAARPDAIVLSSYEPGYRTMPSVEAIRLIRSRWHIPIIAVWWDTCYDGFWRSIEPVLPYVDVHVVPDNPLLNFFSDRTRAQYGNRFLALWEAMDPAMYNNPGLPRDINVAFLGQASGYRSTRMQYMQHLMEHNVPIYTSLFNRADQPSHEKYLEVLKRTKIGLNFSGSLHSDQLKSRVFETISCGALLMENDNLQTRCYFTPMQDYVSFESPSDLVDKIRHYLDHDDERLAIAARGEQKVRQIYNGEHFWKAIFNKLEEVRTVPL
jgi:preprotein translocase subunit Sss1